MCHRSHSGPPRACREVLKFSCSFYCIGSVGTENMHASCSVIETKIQLAVRGIVTCCSRMCITFELLNSPEKFSREAHIIFFFQYYEKDMWCSAGFQNLTARHYSRRRPNRGSSSPGRFKDSAWQSATVALLIRTTPRSSSLQSHHHPGHKSFRLYRHISDL